MKPFVLGVVISLVVGVAACQVEGPPRGLEATCARSCESRAPQCSPHQCHRGCNFVIDRLAENEGDHVLSCVAQDRSACDDRAWARCGTRVGPHADGGPPAPKPVPDVMDDDGE